MEIPLKGNINDVSLVKILVYINRNRKTGTLSLMTPVFTKKIFIDSGNAIFASSTYVDDRLGEMLLKANKITFEQYDRSVEVMKSSKNKRLGAILVELGYITPKDLFWGVKYQVKEIIESMFLAEDADYEFLEGDLPTQEVITLRMSMGNLIYEGAKRIENWTRIRSEMPDTGSVLRLSDDPLSLFQDIELSSQDKKILSLVDGKRTLREVIENSWMGSFEALKILYVLWSIGIVKQVPAAVKEEEKEEEPVTLNEILQPLSGEDEPLLKKVDTVYSRLDSMRMDELLEIDGRSDTETIKKNYYRLAKEFHPDRYFATADESVKGKLAAIFDAVTRAYNTLKEDGPREEYFASLAGPQKPVADKAETVRAEDQFRRGVEEFKKGNFWGAVENFKWAARIKPGSATYWNYLSLAFSRIPGRIKDAEEALQTALELEPDNADLTANLGLIYLKAGLRKRAETAFEKALSIDSSNEKARKGLQQVQASGPGR